MADAQSLPEIVDEASGRFVLEADGAVAELDYELEGDTLILVHTKVPDELGGRVLPAGWSRPAWIGPGGTV